MDNQSRIMDKEHQSGKIDQFAWASAASQAYDPKFITVAERDLSPTQLINLLNLNTSPRTFEPGSSLEAGANRRLEGDLGEGGRWNKAKAGAE